MAADTYLSPMPAPGTTGASDLRVCHAATSGWRSTYARKVLLIDAVAATMGAAGAALFAGSPLASAFEPGLVLVAAWLAALACGQAYDPRIFGAGVAEYRRVARSAIALVALVALVSSLTSLAPDPGTVVPALAFTGVGCLAGRWALRRDLRRLRRNGECMRRVVVVGHPAAVEDMVTSLTRESHHGYEVVGAVLPTSDQRPALMAAGVPVLGGFERVLEAVQISQADLVAVLSAPELTGQPLRRLAWSLEGTACDLVIAPGLVDVAAPRLSIAPVAGLPLLHVEHPEFSGMRRLLKVAFDRCLATVALVTLAPLLLGIGVAVRTTSEGPAVFRQTRIGKEGRPFTMLKFRTMTADAEHRLHELSSDSVGVLFKMRRDPRITRLGAVLRRYSLDELPQLVNVVRGEMSLVGPRPPLPAEVALYEPDTVRRLLVEPGLTGLWQVSGRSELSWDASVRLDLRYIDNWSLTTDLAILWKTARAVLHGSGAY